MWKKDILVEFREALAKLPEDMAKVLEGARGRGPRDGDGPSRGRRERSPLSEPLHTFEQFSRGLGTIVPGLTQFSHSLRNIRVGLDALGGLAQHTTQTTKMAATALKAAPGIKEPPAWEQIGANFLRLNYGGRLKEAGARMAEQMRARRMFETPEAKRIAEAGGQTQVLKNGLAALSGGVNGGGVGGGGSGGGGGGGVPGGRGAAGDGGAGRSLGMAALARSGLGRLGALAGSTPVMLGVAAGAAIVGATAPLWLPPMLARRAEGGLESQRSLSEFSGMQAGIFANFDLQMALRQRQLGDMTANTTSFLAGSLADYKRLSLPRDTLLQNMKNTADVFRLGIGRGIEENVNPIFDAINRKLFGDEANPTSFADVVGRIGRALGKSFFGGIFTVKPGEFWEPTPNERPLTPWHAWTRDILNKKDGALRPQTFDYPNNPNIQ